MAKESFFEFLIVSETKILVPLYAFYYADVIASRPAELAEQNNVCVCTHV